MLGFGLLTLGPAGIAVGVLGYAALNDRPGGTTLPLVGTEVHDGAVTFVVHTLRCGTAEPDQAMHGRLCELTVAARNDGPHEVTVPASIQRLAGPRGARHLPVPDGDPVPFGTLAPGEAATARITYDLPEHASITHVEVHADPTTDGTAVGLPGPPLPLLSAPALGSDPGQPG